MLLASAADPLKIKTLPPALSLAFPCLPPLLLCLLAILAAAGSARPAAAQPNSVARATAHSSQNYAGFDRNGYPGDDRLGSLRQSFAYAGYWLNNPPGADQNGWAGKRALLRGKGFGFLILFNGRLDAALVGKDAAALGRADAQAAAMAAAGEGFPPGAIVFLDQEEGGRLLPEQSAYLFSWVEQMRKSQYRAGIYCSGIEVGSGKDRISTAEDILNHESKDQKDRPAVSRLALPAVSRLALWIANDQCPPSPGCSITAHPPAAGASGFSAALVWQYAQSPRRPQFTQQCAATYDHDGNCYAPGMAHDTQSFLDLDVSTSPDPSHGR